MKLGRSRTSSWLKRKKLRQKQNRGSRLLKQGQRNFPRMSSQLPQNLDLSQMQMKRRSTKTRLPRQRNLKLPRPKRFQTES